MKRKEPTTELPRAPRKVKPNARSQATIAQACDLIDANTYTTSTGELAVSLRLPTRGKRGEPTAATRITPASLKAFIKAGGSLSMWYHPYYGPAAKLDSNRTVLLARWLANAGLQQGVSRLDGNVLNLLDSNLSIKDGADRKPERLLMKQAIAERKEPPYPFDLTRVVKIGDLITDYLAKP